MTERELIGKLNSIRLRARVMLLAYGVGLMAAVIAGGFLLPVAIDYLLRLPGPVRGILAIGLLIVLGYSVWRFLWLPIRARISLEDVALKLEARFPQFNDRLASAVNFMTHPNEQTGASQVLVREVVRDSGERTAGVRLAKVLTARATSLAVLVGVVGSAVLLTMLAINPNWVRTGFDRMFMPMAGAQWERQYSFESMTHGQAVPVGQPCPLQMKLKQDAAPEAYVYFRKASDSDWKRETMVVEQKNGRTVYHADEAFKNPEEPGEWQYYYAVRERGHLGFYLTENEIPSERFTLKVVARPRVDAVDFRVIFPPYREHPDKVGTVNGGTIPVLKGATLQLDARVNDRVDQNLAAPSSFQYRYTTLASKGKGPTSQPDARPIAGQPGMFRFETVVAEDFQLEPLLTDRDGFSNQFPGCTALYMFKAVADEPPHVRLGITGDHGRGEMAVTVDAVLKATVTADDDYRVVHPGLVLHRENKDSAEEFIELTGQKVPDDTGADRFKIEASHDLGLAALRVKVGDVLFLSARASDNAMPVHLVETDARRIRIISQEELARLIDTLIKELGPEIRTVLRRENNVYDSTAKMLNELSKRDPNADDVKTFDNLIGTQKDIRGQVAGVQKKIDDINRKIEENKLDDQATKDQVNKLKGDMGDVHQSMTEAEAALARAANAIAPARGKNPPAGAGSAGSQPDSAKTGKPSESQPDDNKQASNPSATSKPAGEPTASAGKPSNPSAGKPSDSAGKPSNPSAGKPSDSAGKPSDSAGKPSDSAGKPSDSAGKPSDSAGKPSNSAGKPSDSAGKPSDSAGKPSDSAGSPSSQQPQKSNPAQQNTQQAADKQKEAVKKLQEITQTLGRYGNIADLLRELERILHEQQLLRNLTAETAPAALGKTLDQLDEKIAARLHQYERDQNKLATDTRQLIEDMTTVAQALASTDAAGARAIKEAAEVGTQLDVPGKEASAAVNLSLVHMDESINDQKAAEEGLITMINTLKNRRDLDLAELMKKLDDLSKAIELLIAQQTELLNTNKDAQKNGANKDAYALQAKSKQGVHQEGVKGNTDQVAEQLTAVNVTEGAAAVRAASDSMGQAITHLIAAGKDQPKGDEHAAGAQAAQESAVESLKKALEEVEKAKEALRQQQELDKLVKLKDQLIGIRDREKDLKADSDKVRETCPKEDDLTRADEAALTKQADVQKVIVKDTTEIAGPVKEESVVVAWMLDKVIVSMNESQKGLAGQLALPGQAGKKGHNLSQVATEQTFALKRLDELIKALEDEISDKKSNPPPGGGGKPGKGHKPPLVPTTAELKLLRSMENNVIERTKDLDSKNVAGAAAKDPATEAAVKRVGDDQNMIRKLTVDMMKKLDPKYVPPN